VDVPVTLKIRTGWDREHRNGVDIARIAEGCGVVALAVHGRTRADFYHGSAEYDTIRDIRARVRIPVFANGDIDTPQKAREVLDFTGADGVMIGRASHGAPWIFRAVNAQVYDGIETATLQRGEVRDIILGHLDSLYSFYGEESGVRIARKHLGWYYEQLLGSPAHARQDLMGAADAATQFAHAVKHFADWASQPELGPDAEFSLGSRRDDCEKKDSGP
jgi:tRNA-dihydrouridine synthase B